MSFNPFEEKGIPLERQLRNWSELNVTPYDKRDIHPYSRCRAIVVNGMEVEGIFFSHQMARNIADSDIKKLIAQTRRIEAQQQKANAWVIPGNESTLEVTIGYEQVAVDLTAWLARHEPDPYLRQVYEFGLLEDFDHLYRYANLYEMLEGSKADWLVGGLTEIMPGRPTIFEHRDPADEIRRPMTVKSAHPQSMLNALTVTAAEQQTMNFYMNMGNRPMEPIARSLYLEIAEIEEQHVSHYESILDPEAGWFMNLVLHEYNECWIYHSFMETEPDPRLKKAFETHLAMEVEHLRIARELMKKVEGKDPADMLPHTFEHTLTFEENKAYLREVIANQADLTADGSEFVPVSQLPDDHRYFAYQKAVNDANTPSERVIAEKKAKGGEYRLETEGPHPLESLRMEGSSGRMAYEERTGTTLER